MGNIPILEIALFLVGLVALIKGGDWFVDGATGIAQRFHIPELIIGATVVSIGTTLPEVMVSASAAIKGVSSISYGNALGSVICNTALIAAITVAVRPTHVDRKTFAAPVAFFFTAGAVLAVVAYTTGVFSRAVGIILMLLFVAFIAYTIWNEGHNQGAPETDADIENAAEAEEKGETFVLEEKKKLLGIPVGTTVYSLILLVIGAALIAFGATMLVDNGTVIATWLGVPDTVIALTFVALGTSLPELVTAITSLVKGHSSLSLGNIVGANIFNLVLVLGISVSIRPFNIPADKLIGTTNASLAVDIPVMLGVMAILTIPTLIRGKFSRLQGILLLAIYAGFCVFQFI